MDNVSLSAYKRNNFNIYLYYLYIFINIGTMATHWIMNWRAQRVRMYTGEPTDPVKDLEFTAEFGDNLSGGQMGLHCKAEDSQLDGRRRCVIWGQRLELRQRNRSFSSLFSFCTILSHPSLGWASHIQYYADPIQFNVSYSHWQTQLIVTGNVYLMFIWFHISLTLVCSFNLFTQLSHFENLRGWS